MRTQSIGNNLPVQVEKRSMHFWASSSPNWGAIQSAILKDGFWHTAEVSESSREHPFRPTTGTRSALAEQP